MGSRAPPRPYETNFVSNTGLPSGGGSTGPASTHGATGPTGPAGPPGIPRPTGRQGPQGIPGQNGQNGLNGPQRRSRSAEPAWSTANGVGTVNRWGASGPATGNNTHAILWTGTAASAVDLNPSGFTSSQANGVTDGEQAGSARSANGVSHAMLWRGTAASAVDPRDFCLPVLRMRGDKHRRER